MTAITEKSGLIKYIIKKWPPKNPIDYDISIGREYERWSSFNEIEGRKYKLWFWGAYYATKVYSSDPIFFPVISSYVDNLLEDNIAKIRKKIRDLYKVIIQSEYTEEEPLVIRVENDQVILSRQYRQEINISREQYDRLIDVADAEQIEKLFLRYGEGGPGLRPVELENSYYDILQSEFGVKHHIFSTPLDNYYESYGSDYYEIDIKFGSVGSILRNKSALEIIEAGGSFEVNIIHLESLYEVIIEYLLAKIRILDLPVTLFITYDGTGNYENYEEYVWSKERFLILKNSIAPIISNSKLSNIFKTPEERIQRITAPILTAYEKAMAIAERAIAYVDGAEPLVETPKDLLDVLIIAEIELEAGKMPMKIKRQMPNGDIEIWDINELYDPTSGSYRYFAPDIEQP